MQTTEIEKRNTSSSLSAWVPRDWLAWAALSLASFVVFAVSGLTAHQFRVNKALAEEIRLLKKKLEQI